MKLSSLHPSHLLPWVLLLNAGLMVGVAYRVSELKESWRTAHVTSQARVVLRGERSRP